MTAFRNRLLGLAAGTLALSSFSSMAYAQLEVLDFAGSVFHTNNPNVSDNNSYFTFNQSMILNNIGWVYDSSVADANYIFVYMIGTLDSGGNFTQPQFEQHLFSANNLDPATASGIRYLKSFTPLTIASGQTIKIYTGHINGEIANYTRTGFLDNAVGVTHSSDVLGHAGGNLRVTALGGSVAPEPGSFALALTGGAALLGICIRRRRNAA